MMHMLKNATLAALLAACAAPAMAADYVYSSPVAVPGFPGSLIGTGPASVFPIKINVSGAGTNTIDVDLQLDDFRHSFADDIIIGLQGPTGLAILMLADAGGWSNFNGTYAFSDGSPLIGDGNFGGTNTVITPGTYGPSVYGFNPIANLLTSGSSLSSFNGLDPNGTWKVWLWDDSPHLSSNTGSLAGVTLKIATAPVPEPASWAMMIGGMALAGFAMRRRQQRTVQFA